MMENARTNDDLGKKRGISSRQEVVENGGPRIDNNPTKQKARKKIRKKESSDDLAEKQLAFAEKLRTLSVSSTVPERVDAGKQASRHESSPTALQNNRHHDKSIKASWDLESALNHIVRLGGDEKEFLSEDEWVSFRVGHSGDAASLEKCCSNISPKKGSTAEESNTNGELRNSAMASKDFQSRSEQRLAFLADGLGGEEKPPSLFALVAEVSSEKKNQHTNNTIKAAALFTGDEVLGRIRLKKLYVDEDAPFANLLERRVRLRLSALAVLVGYEIVFDSDTE